MTRYIYDGTFSGLLTAIYEGFRKKEMPSNIIAQQDYKPSLFGDSMAIESEDKKADKVSSAIKNKISQKVYRDAHHAFLSELTGIEMNIFNYLLHYFYAEQVENYNWRSQDIKSVKTAASKVRRERHRFKGLLRFRKLQDGSFYAPYSPDYNITGLLAPHFTDRLATEKGVIHDRERNIAAFFSEGDWELLESSEISRFQKENFAESEQDYQQLWQNFFSNISLEERRNPELQKSFMPKKYWEFLIEK